MIEYWPMYFGFTERTGKEEYDIFTYNRRDTTVTINNVMVSFLFLLVAPWCLGFYPQQTLIAMDA